MKTNLIDRSCCFGWVDVVFLPRRVHSAFQLLARHFGDVFHEVAIPTIANELNSNGLATWSRVDCLGSCCSRVGWDVVGAEGVLCAHKIDLVHVRWDGGGKKIEGDVCSRAAVAAKLQLPNL